MRSRVLITGAQGFVGRYLAAHWLEAEPRARILGLGRSGRLRDCFTHEVCWGETSIPAPLPLELEDSSATDRYEYVSLDLAERADLMELLRETRPTRVVHLAGSLRDAPPADLFRNNVIGTRNLLEAIAAAFPDDPPRVVLASTGCLYGAVPSTLLPVAETTPPEPFEPYGTSKRVAEVVGRILSRNHDVPLVVARIFNILGPGQDERHFCGWLGGQLAAAARGAAPPRVHVGTLETTRDFLDVRDLVVALRLLAEEGNPGALYNVGAGVETPMRRIYKELVAISGLADRLEVVRLPARPRDIPRLVADVSRLRAHGFRPCHSLEYSLRDVFRYYLDIVANQVESTSRRPNPSAGNGDGRPMTVLPSSRIVTGSAAPGRATVRVVHDGLRKPWSFGLPGSNRRARGALVELTVSNELSCRYGVGIAPGLLDDLPEILATTYPDTRMVVVTDERVQELYGHSVLAGLREWRVSAELVSLPVGDRAKSFDRFRDLVERAYRCGLDRRGVVVNLGGGMVTDTGGFLAASYMRGVRYVNVPTTLVAQHDAAIGGKVAVNVPWAKNFIGAFHHPDAVFCDPEVLRTLTPRELSAGVAEAIKIALIGEPRLFDLLEHRVDLIRDRRDPVTLGEIVRRAVALKIELLARDPYEVDLRRELNLGHTFGHALETELGYEGIVHGEAVAYGLAVSAVVSRERGLLSSEDLARLQGLLEAYKLLPPIEDDRLFASLERMEAIRLVRGNQLNFVLPEGIGAVRIVPELEEGELARAVWSLVERSRPGRGRAS